MKSDNSPAMIKGKLVAEWKCNKRVSSQYWQIEAPDRVTPMNITSVSPSPIQSIENDGGKYHLRKSSYSLIILIYPPKERFLTNLTYIKKKVESLSQNRRIAGMAGA